MAYAILRTAKLTTKGNLAGSLSHAYRTRETHNANPSLTPSNDLLVAKSFDHAVQNFDERLATVKTVRKNAVLAVEYLITASPDYFNWTNGNGYFDDAIEWLRERHGAENIISAVIHRDETTPHLSVFVVPINEQGKLNARQYLGGRKTLSDMQTDFAQKVALKHGLERGIERSGAEHKTIKDFYTNVNEPLPEVKTQIPEVTAPTLSQQLAEAVGIETDHIRAERQREEAIEQRKQEQYARNKAIIDKAKQYDLEKPSNEQREKLLQSKQAELNEVKKDLDVVKREKQELANQLREIPILDVLERLGAVQDKHDKSKWHTEAGEISITKNDQRFNSFSEPTLKGRGAIDLVTKVRGYSFQEAIKWLSDEFGKGRAVATAVAQTQVQARAIVERMPSPSPIPSPVPEHWQYVRSWLINIRKLNARLIDLAHEAGMLFADRLKNAVFVSKNGKGAEIIGTNQDRPFKGKRGAKLDMFAMGSGGKVAVVESAIDAISLLGTEQVNAVVSTAGMPTSEQYKILYDFAQKGNEILIAFDNDEAGNEFAEEAKKYGFDKRIKSTKKDWNDDVREGITIDVKSQLKPEEKVEPETTKSIAERAKEIEQEMMQKNQKKSHSFSMEM